MMKEIMKGIETFRSLLQNIVCFIGLFCKEPYNLIRDRDETELEKMDMMKDKERDRV